MAVSLASVVLLSESLLLQGAGFVAIMEAGSDCVGKAFLLFIIVTISH